MHATSSGVPPWGVATRGSNLATTIVFVYGAVVVFVCVRVFCCEKVSIYVLGTYHIKYGLNVRVPTAHRGKITQRARPVVGALVQVALQGPSTEMRDQNATSRLAMCCLANLAASTFQATE